MNADNETTQTVHQSKPDRKRPPVYTVWEEFLGWTLDRTAGIPKSQRFTFGQRIDAHSVDIMELIVRAVFSKEKQPLLNEVNHRLEILREE